MNYKNVGDFAWIKEEQCCPYSYSIILYNYTTNNGVRCQSVFRFEMFIQAERIVIAVYMGEKMTQLIIKHV